MTGAREESNVVLVTGASSGIGRACAEHLRDRGHRVWGAARRPERVPDRCRSLEIDVTDDESVREAVRRIVDEEGRLDTAVNNAGIGVSGSVEDVPLEAARYQFEVNFFGTLRVCRAVLPPMRRRRFGLIVNISSIGGLMGLPFQSLYSASKFAVEGLTEALRLEVREFGIRVTLVEPGDFCTGFTDNRRKYSGESRDSPYAERFARTLSIVERDEQAAPAPDRVAELVARLIRTEAPRVRYRVGTLDQRLGAAIKPLLPSRQFERIIASKYDV